MSNTLKIGPADFFPGLVIFDKDGTLIDFNFMWAGWVTNLARCLESCCGFPLAASLFLSFGFDPSYSRVESNGPLATWSMASLSKLAVQVLCDSGLDKTEAEGLVERIWAPPDPVKYARPLADLTRIFKTLRERGVSIAVATSDDRSGTEATLAGLRVAEYVDAVVAADDGIPTKPSPEMVFYLCRMLRIAPEQTVVVGDSQADIEMGRSAGAGLTVGVLSGVSSKESLAPYAEVVIPSIDYLV